MIRKEKFFLEVASIRLRIMVAYAEANYFFAKHKKTALCSAIATIGLLTFLVEYEVFKTFVR